MAWPESLGACHLLRELEENCGFLLWPASHSLLWFPQLLVFSFDVLAPEKQLVEKGGSLSGTRVGEGCEKVGALSRGLASHLMGHCDERELGVWG